MNKKRRKKEYEIVAWTDGTKTLRAPNQSRSRADPAPWTPSPNLFTKSVAFLESC